MVEISKSIAMPLVGTIHDLAPFDPIRPEVWTAVNEITTAARWGITETADLGPEDF